MPDRPQPGQPQPGQPPQDPNQPQPGEPQPPEQERRSMGRQVSSDPNVRRQEGQNASPQQGNPHGGPPGQDAESPGLGKEDAPGQQKPRAEQQR